MATEAAADQQVELVIHQSGLVGVFISCFFFFLKVNVLTKLLYLFSAASNRFVLKNKQKKKNKKFFTPARAKSTLKGFKNERFQSFMHAVMKSFIRT